MQPGKLDLNLFVIFDVIYREANLTRASRILHITQPAVSNALARLRLAFGDPLFVRSGRRMIPTPLAQNMITQVRTSLKMLNACVQQSEQYDPATSDKRFNLAIGEIAETLLFPTLLAAFHNTGPGLKLRSFQVPRTEILKQLTDGDLDLAIDVLSNANPLLQHCRILQDQYVLVMRKGHPFGKKYPNLEDYLSLNHIDISARKTGTGFVDLALNKTGNSRNIMLRSQHFQSAFQMIETTDLVLTAPQSLIRQSNVQTCPLPFDVPPIVFHLYWHKNAQNDRANRWLRDMIIECAGQISPELAAASPNN